MRSSRVGLAAMALMAVAGMSAASEAATATWSSEPARGTTDASPPIDRGGSAINKRPRGAFMAHKRMAAKKRNQVRNRRAHRGA